MAFKAKYDGKCVICNGVIHGSKQHGLDNAMEITWPRRTVVKGQVQHVNPSCEQVAAGILTPQGTSSNIAPAENDGVFDAVNEALSAAPAAEPVATVAPATNVNAILDALKKAGVSIPDAAIEAVIPSPSKPKTKLNNSAKWYQVLEALLNAMAKRVLLVGPPGTGKSTTAMLLGGKKVYRITMTEGTGVEDLLGMFQLKQEKGVTVTLWVDGPVTRAMREGARLQIDEVTHTPPEIQSLLYAVLDDKPQITLPNGEELIAHPDYNVVCTTNDNAAQLEPALMDRQEAILLATLPHPAALKDCSAASQAVVMNFYKNIDTTPWKFNRPPQVRPVRSFERLRSTGMFEDEVIAKAIFGESAKEFLSAISTSANVAKGGR